MKILFITATRIGDAVLSSGLLHHLAETYPQARFTVACGAVAAPLFEAAAFVERVIPMVKGQKGKFKLASHWRNLWLETAFTAWSMVVDLRGSAMAYVLPTLRRRVLKSSWEPKHRLIHLAGALGLDHPLPPVLWQTEAQRRLANQLIPHDGTRVIALSPAANWGAKQWPQERFAQLAQALTAPGGAMANARVAVLAAPSEAETGYAVLNAVPANRRIDLIGKVDLPTLGACLARADLFVGNDSGLMHMAAASGCPTLGLFGPSSEIFYGPWGRRTMSVRGPRSFEDICHAPEFDYKSHACLMEDLTLEQVLAAATRLVTEGVMAP